MFLLQGLTPRKTKITICNPFLGSFAIYTKLIAGLTLRHSSARSYIMQKCVLVPKADLIKKNFERVLKLSLPKYQHFVITISRSEEFAQRQSTHYTFEFQNLAKIQKDAHNENADKRKGNFAHLLFSFLPCLFCLDARKESTE